MATVSHRQGVLRKYKELLRLVERLPSERNPSSSYERARAEMRRGREETDEERIVELRRQLDTRIAFLRSVTPRRPGERTQAREGTFVACRGEVVEGQAEQETGRRASTGVLSWEDAKKKHHQLLKRQHFGRKPPKNPVGPL